MRARARAEMSVLRKPSTLPNTNGTSLSTGFTRTELLTISQ